MGQDIYQAVEERSLTSYGLVSQREYVSMIICRERDPGQLEEPV